MSEESGVFGDFLKVKLLIGGEAGNRLQVPKFEVSAISIEL